MSRSSGRHHAGLDQLDRLHHQRGDQPGGDEAGDVPVDHDDRLADLLGEGARGGQRRVAGLVAADQLAELHHRHRREEVGADDRLGPLGDRGDLGDRDGRGVGGEHRVGLADLVQRAEHVVLDLELLEDRLDHDVRVGHRLQVGGRGDPGERRLDLGRLDPALLGELRPATSGCRRCPAQVAASSRSRSVTCQPACAATWAMPEPISPAPTTASRPAICFSLACLSACLHPSRRA